MHSMFWVTRLDKAHPSPADLSITADVSKLKACLGHRHMAINFIEKTFCLSS